MPHGDILVREGALFPIALSTTNKAFLELVTYCVGVLGYLKETDLFRLRLESASCPWLHSQELRFCTVQRGLWQDHFKFLQA